MHPAVWEARREVQRRSAAAGLYNPHVGAAVGGGGFTRAEMQHVEEFVYRHSGLGLGLAALGWTEGANPAIEHCSDAAREQWLEPLMAGEITAAFANTEISRRHRRPGDGDPRAPRRLATGSSTAPRPGSPTPTSPTSSRSPPSPSPAPAPGRCRCSSSTRPRPGSPAAATSRRCSTTASPASCTSTACGCRPRTSSARSATGSRWPWPGSTGDASAAAGCAPGWGEWLLARAIDRARERTSGGRPIAELQAVQHMLADMDADVYAARAASLQAQAELDAMPGGAFGDPAARRRAAPHEPREGDQRRGVLPRRRPRRPGARRHRPAARLAGGEALPPRPQPEDPGRHGGDPAQRDRARAAAARAGRSEARLRSPDASSPSTHQHLELFALRAAPSTTTSSSP